MNGGSSKKNNNIYKINIIRPPTNENTLIANNQNQLFLNYRTPKRKKSNLQTKMENAYCVKKYKNEHGSSGALILKEFHKSKSINANKVKESDSNLDNNSNTEKISKIEKDISPEVNHNINYNININNSNTNEILDIINFTNNLYNRDNHLQKEIPTKKIDINNLSNFDKNFKNDSTKKKLFIQFGLNNPRRKSSKTSKIIPIDNGKDKTNFSNYLQLKEKQISVSGDDNKIDSSENDENVYVNNIKKGNFTSKSTKKAKFKTNSSKNKKNKKFKNKTIYENLEQENENEQSISRSKQTVKTNKESTKNFNKQISKIKSEVKKEGSNADNADDINEENKNKKKFRIRRCFCCLNPDLDDSI